MNHPKGEESTGASDACSLMYHLSSKALYCGRASPDKLRPGRTFEGPGPVRRVPALSLCLEEFGAVGRRGAEVLAPELGDHPSARRPLQKAELQQVRLVHVLDRVLFLAERDCKRR